MKTNQKQQHRILAIFMHRKLNRIMKDLSLQELTQFLNEKGWYMYVWKEWPIIFINGKKPERKQKRATSNRRM